MKNITKILFASLVSYLSNSLDAGAWELTEINTLPTTGSGERLFATLNFLPQTERQDNVYELEVKDDDGFLTLACVSSILRGQLQKSEDKFSHGHDRQSTRLHLLKNDNDMEEINTLTLCHGLIKAALPHMAELIHHDSGFKECVKNKDEFTLRATEFGLMSINDFTYETYFDLFGSWLRSNFDATHYNYEVKCFSDNSTLDLPKTVKFETLGLYREFLNSLEVKEEIKKHRPYPLKASLDDLDKALSDLKNR